MKIIGNWLTDLNDPAGKKYFEQMYKRTWQDLLIDYEVFNVAKLSSPLVKHIVFLEHDGSVNQIFVLEENDHVIVYSGCGGEKGRYFNTDGIAFMRIRSGDKYVGAYAIDSSPYDYTFEEAAEETGILAEDVLLHINKRLAESGCDSATVENIVLVQQL